MSVGHPRPYTRSGSAFPGSGPISSPSQQSLGTGTAQAPFVPLMSLKCLAWAPASPTPTRQREWGRTGQSSCQLSSAEPSEGWHWGCLAPTHQVLTWGPPFFPLYFRGLPKMQIPGHNYWIGSLEVSPGMCISVSTPGDRDA